MVNITSFSVIQGISQNAKVATATRRGTVESVMSCMDVNTCTKLISALMIIAAAKIGALTRKAICSVWRVSSTASFISMHGLRFFSEKLIETLQQRTHHQIPAVRHHKKKNFQRRGNDYRRQLHHAHGSGDGRDHHIHHHERQIQDGANLEAGFHFRKDVGGNHHAHRQIFRLARPRDVRQLRKQRQIFFARELQHEIAQRSGSAQQRLHGRNFMAFQRSYGHLADLRRDGLHHEIREKQSQAQKRLVAWRGLRSQRLAQEMENDNDAHERSHRKQQRRQDRKSTRLNSSHDQISYAV